MAKTKYNENFPVLAEGYAREGLIDVEIAKKLGISKNTFYKYISKYNDFRDSIKRGKRPVDFEVESKLLQRAKGYKYKETKTIYLTTPQEIARAKKGGLEVKNLALRQEVTEKEVIPDVTAQIFWLKNRKPDEWRDVKGIDGKMKISIEDIQDLIDD